ncbi:MULTISPECIES: sugar ABC transporter permease [unclassified Chelatococcus]|uniref:carbohydrate ABC transporter permease n=1 Tax=unclassified Chelatococcus TaxID=2638111 RepID=UPI00224BBFCA|nr:sugar ABC transporter permease [Chelatococcus sp.]MCO5074588.1 sugar ABC transporter permease [Chelatococcus sp.]CAH1650027.1 Multiple sugar transport system permease protein [Hyphomicrobiales bacterium]CAH1692369.1 Multiple sugar transport system permease protein [Hyphomicrobiales bacterium]
MSAIHANAVPERERAARRSSPQPGRTPARIIRIPERVRNALGFFPFLAPVHVLLLSIIVIPSFYVGWLSLNTSSFGQAPVYVGLANYMKVLADPAFREALINTGIIVVVAVHLELVLALGMALLFAGGLPGRRFLLVAVLAPYAISEVTAVAMWRFLFDPDIGPVTMALKALHLPILEWSYVPSHGLLIIALLTIWLHLPFTFVILYAARLAIPGELYEAAKVDGATTLQSFRRVTLPLLGPAMLIALLFRYIFAFRLFSEVWLMTQGGPARSTEVVAVYLYQEAFRFNAFGTAAATAWIMVLISLLLAAGYVLILRRQGGAHAH